MDIGGPYLSSPDQPSSVYPDRLIRPLPKKTLRSRLSQEAAESITFPPNPPSTNLPGYGHYGQNGEYVGDTKAHFHQNGNIYDHDDADDDDQCPHHHQHCDHDIDDDDVDSAGDSSPIAPRHSSAYRSSPRSPRSRHTRHSSYGGKSSSAPDSYEAFENTNNKKKRKIPTSGNLGLHHSSLTTDLAAMGISSTKDGVSEEPGYYASASPSNNAMQGLGRGSGGRKTRNPLGVSVNGSNVRGGPAKYDQNTIAGSKLEETKSDQGIISAAIANATALLRNPLGKNQENVGVLDQQAKAHPSNSQFTFTCESDAKGVKFPEQSLYSPDYSQRSISQMPVQSATGNHKFSTQGTQTNPGVATHHNTQGSASQQLPSADAQAKKPRRRRGDVYALAARQRKLQQEYVNLQHPPASEDIWICEFCEYESIFGVPPRALIRQYETKDRQERKRFAEKQRLLEKAKLKGRKNKKQTKSAVKAANHSVQQPVNQQAYDQQQLDAKGDDYLDDGYEDDAAPMPAPLPPNVRQQAAMPGSYNTNSSVGKASSTVDRGGVR